MVAVPLVRGLLETKPNVRVILDCVVRSLTPLTCTASTTFRRLVFLVFCGNDVYAALSPTQSAAQVRYSRLWYCSFASYDLDWWNFARSTRARSVNRTDGSFNISHSLGFLPRLEHLAHRSKVSKRSSSKSRCEQCKNFVQLWSKESNRSAVGCVSATNKAKDHLP